MKADININDVDLHGSADSKGTIGELDATITWTSDGIKETVQGSFPFLGGLVNSVSTNPGAGTIELSGALGLGSVTVKPQVADGGLTLQVCQRHRDGRHAAARDRAGGAGHVHRRTLTKQLSAGYSRPTACKVTNDGVVARFSTRDASIPAAQT